MILLPLLAVAVLWATQPAGRWIRRRLQHWWQTRREERARWAASQAAWQAELDAARSRRAWLEPVRAVRDEEHEADARGLRPWQYDVRERAR